MFTTRAARSDDLDPILELLPRLADYPLPNRRESEMFWRDDAALVAKWARGDAPDTHVRVAVDDHDHPVGTAIISLRDDMFSKERCAHLEVVVVAPEADGKGLGRTLIDEVEHVARDHGATIMSLHVLGNNARARHVYDELGFDEEMIRAVKFLD